MRPYLFWFYRLITKRNLLIAALVCVAWVLVTRKEPETAPQALAADVSVESFDSLTDAEQQFYYKSYDYAMDTLKEGKTYEWRTSRAFGSITVGKQYVSHSKAICRDFTETYTFGGSSGEMEGVACKRQGRDGWCKLRKGDMLSCAFEPEETIFDILRTKAGDAADTSYNRGKGFLEGLWPF